MTRLFPSLPDHAGLTEVFQAYPGTIPPLLDFHDRLLRGDSPLSIAERELIAAYTSGLNACSFCHDAHRIYAQAFGIAPAQLDQIMNDLDSADIDPKLKPLLAYIRQLTLQPSRMRTADAQAVYDVGWSERALFDAVQVCALFNFMNRIIEGSGVAVYPQDPGSVTEADLEARRRRAYSDWGREIGVIDDARS